LGILSGMSRVLDIKVIAEGVETEEQFRFVNLAGFGEVQGYLFGKPAPIDQLRPERLRSRQVGIPA
ncbi:MAG: EAL domain-containing protein, partial [Hyphomonas sp.]|nr:EAL domain-containing protein [Hyphomonas sp.]